MQEPRILAENDFLVALDKPAGLIVHSDGRTEESSLSDWILKHYPALEMVGEPWLSPQGNWYPRPGIVHRLDRTTSGVIILAKTDEAYHYLKGEFKARRIAKRYRAIVYGHMQDDEGEIVATIARSKEVPRRWYAKTTTAEDPRAAISAWRVVRRRDDTEPISDVEVMPRTGRTHQIRVHFAHIGHALVSDPLYAKDRVPRLGFTRPALHALTLSVCLPHGVREEYESPLPKEFL